MLVDTNPCLQFKKEPYMNYFELCNEILSELFFETVPTFEELEERTEGIRVKRLLNRTLLDICNNEQRAWKFRQRHYDFMLVEGVSLYDKPNGFIRYLRYPDISMKIYYLENHQTQSLNVKGQPLNYWIEDDKIRIWATPSKEWNNKSLICHYLTYDYAIDKCGVLKPKMELETDMPIIPEQHQNVLIYGVCKDWRANAADAQVNFYNMKYKEAYKALLDNCMMTEEYPDGLSLDLYPTDSQSAILDAFYKPITYGDNN